MRAPQASLALIAAMGLLAPVARSQESFANEDIGYRVRLPGGYKKSGAGLGGFWVSTGGDKYLIDSFESSKNVALGAGWPYELRMSTFWFPARSAAEVKRAELEAEKAAKEKKEGEAPKLSFLVGGRVIQSFDEYAKQRFPGFYFGEEKKQTIADFPAVLRPMIFEKLQNTPQHWLACTFAVPGGEFAIVFNAPESHFDKLRAEFMNTFKSFKITRAEGLKVLPLVESIDVKDGPKIDTETMSPDQIRKVLADEREKAFAKALASLEKNWKSFTTENYLVLYETEQKYAKLAAQQAEDLRAWLEVNFASIGDGYEQSAILKIFKYDNSNTITVTVTAHGAGPIVEEIEFRQPISKGSTAEFAGLNRSVMSNWFRLKNQELWNRLPRWLATGLTGVVEDAERIGGKLRFEPDEWEKNSLVDAFNEQKRWEKAKTGEPPLKDVEVLLKMTSKEWSGDNWRYTPAQCSSLVRYLVEGPGSRGKTGAILRNYITHLYGLVADVEKRMKAEQKEREARAAALEGMSDEEKLAAEDEAYKKKRKEALDSVEKELLDKAFTLTFSSWDEEDWRTLDRAWLQYAEGRTK